MRLSASSGATRPAAISRACSGVPVEFVLRGELLVRDHPVLRLVIGDERGEGSEAAVPRETVLDRFADTGADRVGLAGGDRGARFLVQRCIDGDGDPELAHTISIRKYAR